MDSSTKNLLAIVLDTNFIPLIVNGEELGPVIDAVMTFCSTHLMMTTTNKLFLMALHGNKSVPLFPPTELIEECQTRGHYEVFSQLNSAIGEKLKLMMLNEAVRPRQSSRVAASLASCLCYVNKMRRKSGSDKFETRLLVISTHVAVAKQYMDFMNVFFVSLKFGIQLDACLLGVDSDIVRQGSDITGGVCLCVPNVRGLLLYLLWLFLPFGESRRRLTLPAPPLVDYRAACFCHRQLVNIGFVCSVCLSVFCKFAPMCSTCHMVFKTKGILLTKPNKRRKK